MIIHFVAYLSVLIVLIVFFSTMIKTLTALIFFSEKARIQKQNLLSLIQEWHVT